MDVQLKSGMIPGLKSGPAKKKEQEATAMQFEKLFARQLVKEMTKGLFKHDDNKSMMSAGSDMYRDQIVNTLAEELAQQRKLGVADIITNYVDKKSLK